MPRGYRLAYVAAFGCLIAASPSYNHGQRDRGSHRKTQASVAVSPPAPLPPSISADDGKSTSDRCVGESGNKQSCEVISAQASADQARYSGYQAFIAAVQTLIVLAALVAAWRAAYWAREAAIHTKRSADIAETNAKDAIQALKIAERNAMAAADLVTTARENARRETKAYVGISGVQIFAPVHGSNINRDPLRYQIIVSVKNYGRTPAKRVRLRYGIEIGLLSDSDRFFLGKTPLSAGSNLSPTASFNIYIPLTVSRFDHEQIVAENKSIFLHTDLSFEDVFDGDSMAKNGFWSSGETYEEGRMTSMLDGTTV